MWPACRAFSEENATDEKTKRNPAKKQNAPQDRVLAARAEQSKRGSLEAAAAAAFVDLLVPNDLTVLSSVVEEAPLIETIIDSSDNQTNIFATHWK
jgi:hypothetical protein